MGKGPEMARQGKKDKTKVRGEGPQWLAAADEWLRKMNKHPLSVTLLLADMADSTKYMRDHSLAEGFLKTFRHNHLFTTSAKQHNGIIIKEIGDEVMCKFDDGHDGVVAAIETACECLRRFAEGNRNLPTRPEKIMSKAGIHRTCCAAPYPEEGSTDLVGPCVNLAARIVAHARKEQVLISEQAYKTLTPAAINGLKRNNLKIGEPTQLVGLKGLENDAVLVREVLWDGRKRGIGPAPGVHVLTLATVRGGDSAAVLQRIRRKVPSDQFVGGGVLFGTRDLFLRLQTLNLKEYRELVTDVMQGVDGLQMTYSSFVFPDCLYSQPGKNDVLVARALVLISSGTDAGASYKIVKKLADKAINTSNDANTPWEILEVGALFGEYEAYALVCTRDEAALADFIQEEIRSHANLVSRTATSVGIRVLSGGDTFIWHGASLRDPIPEEGPDGK